MLGIFLERDIKVPYKYMLGNVYLSVMIYIDTESVTRNIKKNELFTRQLS